jgi:hypothetical protein
MLTGHVPHLRDILHQNAAALSEQISTIGYKLRSEKESLQRSQDKLDELTKQRDAVRAALKILDAL